MKELQFKIKYFTDNFYWVNKDNYKKLQEIGVEMGCLNPSGKESLIGWHEEFRNLGFRTYKKNKFVTYFQKEPFLIGGKKATDYNQMLLDYEKLNP